MIQKETEQINNKNEGPNLLGTCAAHNNHNDHNNNNDNPREGP